MMFKKFVDIYSHKMGIHKFCYFFHFYPIPCERKYINIAHIVCLHAYIHRGVSRQALEVSYVRLGMIIEISLAR
jgi:hypothetical protein